MKMKSLCLFKTERANNHIKQGDACFFARDAIGVSHYRHTAMFTSVFHIFFAGKQDAISELFWCLDKKIRSLNGLIRHCLPNKYGLLVHLVIISEGNSRCGRNF